MLAGKLDLKVEQGSDDGLMMTLKDKTTGIALDITGWAFPAQIRRRSDTGAKLADVTPVPQTPLSGGRVYIPFPHVLTATLEPGTHAWGIKGVNAASMVIPLLEGKFIVTPAVVHD